MLIAEGNLEPGQDVLQLLFVLLPDTLLDGLGQMTVAVILQCGKEHLSPSSSLLPALLLLTHINLHGQLAVLDESGVLHHEVHFAFGPVLRPLPPVLLVMGVQHRPEDICHHPNKDLISLHLAVRAGLKPVS